MYMEQNVGPHILSIRDFDELMINRSAVLVMRTHDSPAPVNRILNCYYMG